MSLNAVKILEISITKNSKKEILEYIQKYLQSIHEKPITIVTPNAEQLVAAHNDKRFAQVLNNADIALPDGFSVARLMGVRRIAGVEFMEDLITLAANQGYPIGLIGGRDRVAVEALECLSRRSPNLVGWALEPEEQQLQDIVNKIRKTKTKIVFVGLGAPKQEYYSEKLAARLTSNLIIMSVGGSFDIISGRIPRAPLVFQEAGLEWVWRLAREPWRVVRQIALVRFLLLVFRQKLTV